MKNIYNLAAELDSYLRKSGIKFNQYGYPIIPEDCLLQEEPKEILPYDHRNSCNDSSKTVICYFMNDQRLYPRLFKLEEDLKELRKFMGVGGFDLSPRREHDKSLQEFNLLLSHMVDAYHAVNGIKVLPNFRTGNIDTIHSLSVYPSKSLFLAGSLGCSKRFVKQSDTLLRTKLLYTRPKEIIVYGTLEKVYQNTLDELGQDYRCYKDFRTASWRKKEVA